MKIENHELITILLFVIFVCLLVGVLYSWVTAGWMLILTSGYVTLIYWISKKLLP